MNAEQKTNLKVLCLEDVPKDAEFLKEMLVDAGYHVDMDIAENEEEFKSSLKSTTYHVILADYTLPGFNATEALKLANNLQPRTPFICISGTIGEEKAVELVKQGATDYVLKDRIGRLVFSVNRALTDAARQDEWERTQSKLRDKEIIERQNEELRKLNITKDKFFSIIAHDLRNPFNSILGFSQILMKQTHQMDRDKIVQIAQIINHASQMAVDLLMNLIEWSLSQSGRIEFHPEEVPVEEIVNEADLIMAPAARQKKIQVNYEVPVGLSVFADKQLLGTVLRNLLSNAVKFTRPGGEVTLSAREQDSQVVISVTDSGIGIPAERLDKLFRIDESFSTEGTGKEKGTGLGLILCREFVEKHGGKIWAESKGKHVVSQNSSSSDTEPGGSTFSFSIPRHQAGKV
jgi:two-component system, sensor histidine kinase and response regulator